MELSIVLTAPLVGCSRQTIEEEIENWLGAAGEIVGGGAATDGSFADIDLVVQDQAISRIGLPAFLEQLRTVLRVANAPSSSRIVAFVSDDTTEESTVG
jgi:hypothetical protein